MLCIHFLEYLDYFFFSMATQWCSSSSLEIVGNLLSVGNKYIDEFTNKTKHAKQILFASFHWYLYR